MTAVERGGGWRWSFLSGRMEVEKQSRRPLAVYVQTLLLLPCERCCRP